jgi:hypothetical protein
MSFCPKCRYEYQSGVMICPDCNETLVDHLQPTAVVAQNPDDSWVAVGAVSSTVKAELAKGSLDSSNIPSVILSSSFGAYGKFADFSSQQFLGKNEGNIIMVPREYLEEAEILLEGILGDDYESPSVS